MKKPILLLMAVLLISSLFCGCKGGNGAESATDGAVSNIAEMTDEEIKDEIVGAWVAEVDGSKQGYIFLEDGTGFATILPLTYTVEDGMLNIKIEAFGQVETISAEYNVKGVTLTI